MNNKQFINALKKALAGLDINSRNDIIQEIESHGVESGASLIDQFGSVDELAAQYLDGEKLAKPISQKIWGFSKNVLITLGAIVISLIALTTFLSFSFTKDDFNYADENAEKLRSSNTNWTEQPWTTDLNIEVDQGSAVFYWHDADTVRWHCEGAEPTQQDESSLFFSHSHCLVYVPRNTTNLKALQSQVVLVRPQVSLDVTVRQGSVKVAENGEQYQYKFDARRAEVKGLNSQDGAEHTLQFTVKEGQVVPYKY